MSEHTFKETSFVHSANSPITTDCPPKQKQARSWESRSTFDCDEKLEEFNVMGCSTDPLISSPKKCSCRFVWNYELHGLTAFLRSKTLFTQILWVLIMLGCTFLAVTTTETMFCDYLDHQTATLITIRQKAQMLLPSVTVCPKNPDALNYGLVIRDISKRLPRMDRITVARLIAFAIGGAGMTNVDAVLKHISDDEIKQLSSLLRRWKGSRTLVEFYEDLFEKNGYKCEEFLAKCFYGYEQIHCCDVFRPHYVMLRGRCFRTDKFYQTDPDVHGKLTIWMNQLPSKISDRLGRQPQSIAYVSDRFPDVATFPRLYIDFHESTSLRVRGRRMVLLPWNNDCSMAPEFRGKACYVRKWLRSKVIEPLNCTVFYLRDKIPGYKVCDPETIVRNYQTVTNTSLRNTEGFKCIPACHRFDHQMRPFRSDTTTPRRFPVPDFRLEISYMDLEIERYEEFLTTSLPGFVSQLGGQSGLFIGTSACTIIQFLLSFFTILYRFIHSLYVQYTRIDLFY